MGNDPNRRDVLLTAGLAAGGLGFNLRPLFAQPALTPTPECRDGDRPTAAQTEGPFYKPRSPQRDDLREPGFGGRPVVLSGYVVTRNCKPVPRVLVDLWHADDKGQYDNQGSRYRGHVLTDDAGRYQFRTIAPAQYPGRTRHYHVKLVAGRTLLTTQLYFPNDPANGRDGLFQRELLMKVTEGGDGVAAAFTFVLDLG